MGFAFGKYISYICILTLKANKNACEILSRRFVSIKAIGKSTKEKIDTSDRHKTLNFYNHMQSNESQFTHGTIYKH